ncbi:transmembrane protein, putative [Medicago truncatula]|uniref:Transmembrane protein, putative n=1 Tax=Medicago truncatula TaxID=3880 RepID=G7L2G3_MEDTR|nr:transmembrane protein, putative [Medicago truncatula]
MTLASSTLQIQRHEYSGIIVIFIGIDILPSYAISMNALLQNFKKGQGWCHTIKKRHMCGCEVGLLECKVIIKVSFILAREKTNHTSAPSSLHLFSFPIHLPPPHLLAPQV